MGKIKLKKEMIERLRNGDIVLHNEGGNVKYLKRILEEAFPDDQGIVSGGYKYYRRGAEGYWAPTNYTSIVHTPAYKIEDFFEPSEFKFPGKWYIKRISSNYRVINEWLIKEKEKVGLKFKPSYMWEYWGYLHSDLGITSEPREGYIEISFEQFEKYVLNMEKKIVKYKLKNQYHIASIVSSIESIIGIKGYYSKYENLAIKADTSEAEKLKHVGVLDVWFEPVYEEAVKYKEIDIKYIKGTLIIRIYSEKRAKVIDEGGLTHNLSANTIEDIRKMVKSNWWYPLGEYPCRIDTIAVGCMHGISIEDIEKALKIYDELNPPKV